MATPLLRWLGVDKTRKPAPPPRPNIPIYPRLSTSPPGSFVPISPGLLDEFVHLCHTVVHDSAAEFVNPNLKLFPNPAAVRHHFGMCPGIKIALGLEEIMHSNSAPKVDWFEKLPVSFSTKEWSVYVLVMRHPTGDEPPALYVGSATAAAGSATRHGDYTRSEGDGTKFSYVTAVDVPTLY